MTLTWTESIQRLRGSKYKESWGKPKQRQIRDKARQLLRYYRINERHPQKLIMNLAYDEHSVDALLKEAKDRWGEIPEAGGSETEDEEPPDLLQFWYLRGGRASQMRALIPSAQRHTVTKRAIPTYTNNQGESLVRSRRGAGCRVAVVRAGFYGAGGGYQTAG